MSESEAIDALARIFRCSVIPLYRNPYAAAEARRRQATTHAFYLLPPEPEQQQLPIRFGGEMAGQLSPFGDGDVSGAPMG